MRIHEFCGFMRPGKGSPKNQPARCAAWSIVKAPPCQKKPVAKQPTEIQCQCLLGSWILSRFWVFLSEDPRRNTTINSWQKDHVGNLLSETFYILQKNGQKPNVGPPPPFFFGLGLWRFSARGAKKMYMTGYKKDAAPKQANCRAFLQLA
jgi:hypothetical protein